jgi:hypothetical protein
MGFRARLNKMSLADRNKRGVLYGTVTSALVATTLGSMQCWASQVGPWSNHALRDGCLFIWAVSGLLLAVSQIIFIVVAWGMNPSVTKLLMLVGGLVILAVIAFFLFALSNMPS